ncbi:T9SS type A sorting domain-containing protein [bacterium]|nr:T9SS type A sorting domain-containing protein [bacterium]
MRRVSMIVLAAFMCSVNALFAQYTWTNIPHTFTEDVMSVAVNSGGDIFAGLNQADPNLLYRTTNNGVSWTPVGWDYHNFYGPYDWFYDNYTAPHVKQLFITHTGVIFAVGEYRYPDGEYSYQNGLYRSMDNGATWDWLFLDPYGSHFNGAMNNNDVIFLAPYERVYASGDYGDTWTCQGDLCDTDLHPVGTAFYHIEVNSAGNVLTSDRVIYGPDQWHIFTFGGGSHLGASFGINLSGLYNGTTDGVYYSDGIDEHSGDSWVPIGLSGIQINDFILPDNGDIYVATNDGIYFSDNNGSEWHQLGLDGIAVAEIQMIHPYAIVALTPSDVIYLGTLPVAGYIVLSSPNTSGITWEQLQEYFITWTEVGDVGPSVKLELLQGTSVIETIAEDTENDDSFKWRISRGIPPADDYRIKISSVTQPDKIYIGAPFSIVPSTTIPPPKTYTAPQIAVAPVIDGVLDEPVWTAIDPDTLTLGGGIAQYNVPWTDFADCFVTWKAAWNSITNRLYVGVTVEDDIRGTFDNGLGTDPYEPYADESLEFFTNGDCDYINYWEQYAPAQFWRVTEQNERNLYNWPTPLNHEYTGSAFNTAVSMGSAGNWTCEIELTIYDTYDTDPKTLVYGDSIGWDVWHNDSDDEAANASGIYGLDDQTGWNYQGGVWQWTDYMGFLKFGPPLMIVDVGERGMKNQPDAFSLNANYPNPFNPSTTISYTVPEAGHVTVTVYDIHGCEIAVLENGRKAPGQYTLVFDGGNLASGVYLCRMKAGSYEQAIRMTLLK